MLACVAQGQCDDEATVLRVLTSFPMLEALTLQAVNTMLTNDHVYVTPSIWGHLSRLPRLQSLSLSCPTTGDMEGLSQLSRLTYLHLVRSPEVSPALGASLSCLAALQTLKLESYRWHVPDLSFISALTSLRCLSISNWRASLPAAQVRQWQSLTSLETLTLASCGELSDKVLAAIACISGLRKLDLSDTRVPDEGVRHLTALTALSTLKVTGVRPASEQLFAHIAVLQFTRTDFPEQPEDYDYDAFVDQYYEQQGLDYDDYDADYRGGRLFVKKCNGLLPLAIDCARVVIAIGSTNLPISPQQKCNIGSGNI